MSRDDDLDVTPEIVADLSSGMPNSDPRDFVDEAYLEELATKTIASKWGNARMEAALAYVLDPDGPTVAAIAADPRFSHIPTQTVERWAHVDGWTKQRKQFLTSWAKQMQSFLGEELVQARVQTWRALQHVESLALAHLENEEVQPRSWEGVLKAYIELTKRSEELYGAISEEITPERVQNSPNVTTVDKSVPIATSVGSDELSSTQLDQLAARILKEKRSAVREEHGIDATEADKSAAQTEVYEHTPAAKAAIERNTEKGATEARLAFIDDETGELI